MTSARAGRRRRLFNDGGSTSAAAATAHSQADDATPGPRYAFRESSVSAALGRDFLPTSWGALAATAFALLAIAAGLVAIDPYGLALASAGVTGGRLLLLDGVGSVAGWVASVSWLVIAVLSLVVFGMRRQRMDDVRCVYRWWVVGAAVAVTLSFNAATHAHLAIGALLGDATGFSPLPAGAFWWLAIGMPVLGMIAIRLVVDASASRLGVAFATIALIALSFGWINESRVAGESLAGLMPQALPLVTVGPACVMAGPLLLILSLLLVSRQIVAEAEGKVVVTRKATTKTAAEESKTISLASKTTAATTTTKPAAKPARREAAKAEPAAAKPTVWTNGGDDYADDYEEDQPKRRLSKAERKRLRKLKARNAA